MDNDQGERVIQRVRHPLVIRRAKVARVSSLSPHMRRIVVSGAELNGFFSPGFDDHVKLFMPAPGAALVLPSVGERGMEFPTDGARPVARDFTPRHFDHARTELTIDVALHAHGPATDWAATVTEGQEVGIGGPRGSMLIPDSFHTHLLIGDETALPAIARRVEELPLSCRAIVLAEVRNAQEQIELDGDCALTVRWAYREDGGPGLVDLLRSLPELLVDAFAWIACESSTAKALRSYLVEIGKIEPRLVKASGYWRRGESAVHDVHET
ncbi:MAG TPA: siderophore-interacting protein [Rhizorhapis sp.]